MAEGDSRRRLLAHLDDLLERVEQLRMRGFIQVPAALLAKIAQAAEAVGYGVQARTPVTVSGAHRLLFQLQGLLLRGGGPTSAPPVSPAGLPPLVLPPPHRSQTEAEWQEQVQLVVQRAHDRARYLAARAATSIDLPSADEGSAATADDVARTAEQAFQHLLAQAQRVTGRRIIVEAPPTIPAHGQVKVNDLVIDLDVAEVRKAGQLIPLTPNERTILVTMVANQGRVITREAIQHLVHGDDPTVDPRSRAIDVHLANLRAKLGHPSYIENIPGVGFRILETAPSQLPSPASIDELRERRRGQRRAWARGDAASQAGPPRPPDPTIERPSGR